MDQIARNISSDDGIVRHFFVLVLGTEIFSEIWEKREEGEDFTQL